MAVTSDLTRGILTGAGTQDVIRTAAGVERVTVLFRNYSGGDVTLVVFINGVTSAHKILDITLATKESVAYQTKFGSGDDIRAEAGAATSISWFAEVETLS